MNAVELKFTNGKGTGFWYCSRCLQVQSDTRVADRSLGRWRSSFKFWREYGDTERNKENAADCCTSDEFRPLCTGCREGLKNCVCGRAKKNLCTGCNKKLWLSEGRFIEFGANVREFCSECAEKLQAKLADAGK